MAGAPKRLRCEYLESPIGIDERRPRLSWWLDDERPAEIQTAYHILASRRPESLAEDRGDLWDSGRTESSHTCHIPYGGRPLTSRQRVWWKVRAFDSDGIGSPWSRATYFEMGLLDNEDWRARWIGTPLMGGKRTPAQVPAVRRSFDLAAAGRKCTALHHRARRVRRRDQRRARARRRTGARLDRFRQTHPLSDVRRDALVDAGRERTRRAARRRLVLRHARAFRSPAIRRPTAVVGATRNRRSPTERCCASRRDDLWKWQRSQILYSDLMSGESVDARQSLGAWTAPRLRCRGLVAGRRVAVAPRHCAGWKCQRADQSDRSRRRRRRIRVRRSGDFGARRLIYDFGQNIVGRVRVKLRAPRGTLIQIRHAERLDDNGELYTANLRKAAATDLYTCSGNPDGETFEPRFTFHGFQFAEVSGHFADAAIEDVTASRARFGADGNRRVPLRPSVAEPASEQHPVEPARQFRRHPDGLPATRRTAWLDGRRAGIRAHRRVQSRRRGVLLQMAGRSDRCASPPTARFRRLRRYRRNSPIMRGDGGPAWSDAIVICPWTIYRCCGDKRLLERHYDAMKAFVDNIESAFSVVDPRRRRGRTVAGIRRLACHRRCADR